MSIALLFAFYFFNKLTILVVLSGLSDIVKHRVLNPNLFVMWDDEIAYQYGLKLFNNNPGKIYLSEGYTLFLKEMQSMAKVFILDFHNQFGAGDPALYLSIKLNVSPPVPLAKLLDEYNWITITNKIEVPPKWHPCDDKIISP